MSNIDLLKIRNQDFAAGFGALHDKGDPDQ